MLDNDLLVKEIFDIPIDSWQAWIPLLPVAMLLGALLGQLWNWLS